MTYSKPRITNRLQSSELRNIDFSILQQLNLPQRTLMCTCTHTQVYLPIPTFPFFFWEHKSSNHRQRQTSRFEQDQQAMPRVMAETVFCRQSQSFVQTTVATWGSSQDRQLSKSPTLKRRETPMLQAPSGVNSKAHVGNLQFWLNIIFPLPLCHIYFL